MDFQIKGKTALITGAAYEGLGRAHAISLANEGVNIVVLDVADASETIRLVKEKGVEAAYFHCDISNEAEVQLSIQKALQQFPQIEIIVNNASILNTVGMFEKLSSAQFERDVAVNLMGATYVTKALWPQLLKNQWGRVVFISSFAGTHGGAGQTSYSATKAAVIGLAKSLALEGARFNVTVNVVAPGVMKSQTVESFIRPDMKERMIKKAALRRLGELNEVADVVCFLSSSQASFITGQVIEVDGGAGLFTF